MAAPNLVIIQLLHTQSNHGEFLRLCWDKLTNEQKKEIFHFLYHSKQHKTFLSVLRSEINSESPMVPWTHLMAILNKHRKLDSANMKSFIHSGSSGDQLGLFRIEQPDLIELWAKNKNERVEKHESRKADLLKELEFAKQRGFRDQRAKILNDLRRLYPHDPEVSVVLQSEKEFHARQTLSKVFSKRLTSAEWSHAPREEMDKKALKSVFREIKKTVKKKPEMALDLAIMFYQMELYTPALHVFDLIIEKSFAMRWHELQICIEGRQFARALSVIEALKSQRLTTDHSFSLLYFQALALYGLGEQSEAKQIIRNIVRIRPGFRSAGSLLLEWENEK